MSKPQESIAELRQERAAVISRRLAELRKELGLSQEALGSLLGTSQATVSRWEDPGSLSTPSALECVEIADRFGVTTDWLLGSSDYRLVLPPGEAIIDQHLLDAFAAARTPADLETLLERDLSFGTVWVQLPPGAQVVSLQEAHRRVREVDRHVRALHAGLWQQWAKLVLG